MMDPYTVSSVAEVMNDVGVWWAVAGGWAIDLWLGEQTREHHDVEVAIRRRDQTEVHAALADRWELFCLDPPGSGWRPWNGILVDPSAFQLQARSPAIEFDIFTELADQTTWYFRRDNRVSLPLSGVTVRSASGIPVIRPEIQLLYMAKAMEAKNVQDFDVAGPRLDQDATSWLAAALAITVPDHQWIMALR
jgi:hypothetical protein